MRSKAALEVGCTVGVMAATSGTSGPTRMLRLDPRSVLELLGDIPGDGDFTLANR
jgi:hypothetical protein